MKLYKMDYRRSAKLRDWIGRQIGSGPGKYKNRRVFFERLIEKTYNEGFIDGLQRLDEAGKKSNDYFYTASLGAIVSDSALNIDTELKRKPASSVQIAYPQMRMLDALCDELELHLISSRTGGGARRLALTLILLGAYRLDQAAEAKAKKKPSTPAPRSDLGDLHGL